MFALACSGGFLLLLKPFNREAHRTGKRLRGSVNHMYMAITEHLSGMKIAKSYNLGNRHQENFRTITSGITDQVVKFAKVNTATRMYYEIGAAAYGFVSSFPKGIDAVVGDRGEWLSGGERQRIALARALLREPSLLLLDEATSSLDTESEEYINDAIDRLHGKLTIVVIAHRSATIQRADRIVVLDKGQIVEGVGYAVVR